MQALLSLLESRYGLTRAVPAARAALGLEVVLRRWRGVRRTCRVAVPGAVCHDVLAAVLGAGCEPLFCDVDVGTGLVKESELARARSHGADVAIVVHLYGNPARIGSVRALYPAGECLIIDDAAQAFGSWSPDGPCGAVGDVGLLSFRPTKHIPLGNAVLLFKNDRLAAEVDAELAEIAPSSEDLCNTLASAFRARLEVVRGKLRSVGAAAASEFSGMLEGLGPTLRVAMNPQGESSVVRALENYPTEIEARIGKSRLWRTHLEGSGLEPVGMGAGCVPWRYVCRYPGIDWHTQHTLAESLRACGMHVSTWYLPVHWFMGLPPGTLPGVEQLAREVFQFWLDNSATHESIERDAALVRRVTNA